MISRLRRSDGYAVPIAIILMVIMLGFGVAALGFVDSETNSSRRERTHETRLNLTEGVVAAQIFQLSRGWPTRSDQELPVSCTETAASSGCPQPAQVLAQFSGVDFKLDPSWNVSVHDNNSSPSFYDDATVLAAPRWDSDGDGEMWVRAEGTLEGKRRIIVARVRVEERPLNPPKAPFVAGAFNTTNNGGSKIIVQTDTQHPGIVRCDNTTYPQPTDNPCVDFESGQISPVGSVQSDTSRTDALPDGMADALKQQAINSRTYYENTCPADPSGDVVWVENANCSYQGNMKVNQTRKQGVFIVNRGTLDIQGGVEWWGLVYMLNAQGCGSQAGANPCIHTSGGNQDAVVSLTGTATIHGGIFIEGSGRLNLGSSGNAGNCSNCLPNLIYDPSVALNITAHGTAGIIQNTWRELLPG
jgi:hypothetical protein